ncbi:MAG TPA: succinyl-diaminopimelate desuccinylase [Polyangiaceae bacterium]|jgi:succinyl-diaminopimelate desuccinylase
MIDETLLWLCSIDSPIGDEALLCDAVERRLEPIVRARRYKNSLVFPWIRGDRSDPNDPHDFRPHVVLAGHLDTVRTENGPARREGERIFGSGSSDMKSGLAVMIELAERVKRADCKYDVTLVFYAREEGPFLENELGVVMAEDPDVRRADFAVCLEPSDNRLQLGCMGSIHATVTVEGRTAHSARPWEGESAVTKAAPLLAEIGALAPEEHVIDGLSFRSVFTITQARDGGRGRNVVPDRFSINLNHRFAPDTTLEQAKQRVLDVVAGRGRVELTDLSPAAMPHRDHPLAKRLAECGVVAVERKQAWTDVARFAALGIPAVNLGPGENAQAHQKNESTSLPLVHEGYRIFETFLTRER